MSKGVNTMLKTKTEAIAEDILIELGSLTRSLEGLIREEKYRNHVCGSKANREFHLKRIKQILKTFSKEAEKLK